MTDRIDGRAFDRHCDRDDRERRHDEAQPIAGTGLMHNGDQGVATHGIERAVCKVDHPAKSEHEAQPEARQQEKRGIDDAVEDVDEQKIPIHGGGAGYPSLQPYSAADFGSDLLAGNGSARWPYAAPYLGASSFS